MNKFIIILLLLFNLINLKSVEKIHIDFNPIMCEEMKNKEDFYYHFNQIENKKNNSIDITNIDTIRKIVDFLNTKECANIINIRPQIILYMYQNDTTIVEYEIGYLFFKIIGTKDVYKLPFEIKNILAKYFDYYLESIEHYKKSRRTRRNFYKGEKGYSYIKWGTCE